MTCISEPACAYVHVDFYCITYSNVHVMHIAIHAMYVLLVFSTEIHTDMFCAYFVTSDSGAYCA